MTKFLDSFSVVLKRLFSNRERFKALSLYFFGCSFLAFGLLSGGLWHPAKLVKDLFEIIRTPDYLLTDYTAVGGLSAAFFNSGALMLLHIDFETFEDAHQWPFLRFRPHGGWFCAVWEERFQRVASSDRGGALFVAAKGTHSALHLCCVLRYGDLTVGFLLCFRSSCKQSAAFRSLLHYRYFRGNVFAFNGQLLSDVA